MSKIFVSGLVNLEMSLQVDYFPIQYNPIEYPFFGISQAVSGVGYNISKALSILGDDAFLTGFIGDDLFSKNIKRVRSHSFFEKTERQGDIRLIFHRAKLVGSKLRFLTTSEAFFHTPCTVLQSFFAKRLF